MKPMRSRRRPERASRSEEHTSELQSLTNLVCRLLLEKKNNDLHTTDGDVHRNHIDLDVESTQLMASDERNGVAHCCRTGPIVQSGSAPESELCVQSLVQCAARCPSLCDTLPCLPARLCAVPPPVATRVALSSTCAPIPLTPTFPPPSLPSVSFSFFFFQRPAPPRSFPFSPTRPSPD